MNFTDLIPDVMPYVPSCPSFTISDHLLRAAREFCRRTHVWQAALTPFNTVVDQQGYALAPPAGSSVVRVFRVDVGDCNDITVHDEVTAEAEVARGSSCQFAWLSGNTLRLNPVPTEIVAVQVQVSVKPTRTATSWPDDLGEDHAEALIYGALSTLYDMPRVDWADDAKAMKYGGRFEAKVAKAARNRSKGRATQRSSRPHLF